MDKLTAKIKELLKNNPVEDYEWGIPEDCPIDIPESKVSSYEKNIYLKHNLAKVVKIDTLLKSHYWIINKWGGINTFKENDKNNDRINKFLKEMNKEILTRDLYNCISSLSKIASFIRPEKYVIYDSRSIYSLNWLLFNYSTGINLFPQPQGRGASTKQYDMETIFKLSKLKYNIWSYKCAYHEYCSLVSKLSHNVFGSSKEPYKIEMLLFMIAPGWTVNNIENTVSVKINKNA